MTFFFGFNAMLRLLLVLKTKLCPGLKKKISLATLSILWYWMPIYLVFSLVGFVSIFYYILYKGVIISVWNNYLFYCVDFVQEITLSIGMLEALWIKLVNYYFLVIWIIVWRMGCLVCLSWFPVNLSHRLII